jgi:uncharacterized protein (TIGR03382 family)
MQLLGRVLTLSIASFSSGVIEIVVGVPLASSVAGAIPAALLGGVSLMRRRKSSWWLLIVWQRAQ